MVENESFLCSSFDRVLHSVRLCANGPDELSRTFLEMKGHFYMHAGTFLLKTAQNNEARWRDACELAALCYLKSFHVSHCSVCARSCCSSQTLSLYMLWMPVFQKLATVFKAVSSPNLILLYLFKRFQVVWRKSHVFHLSEVKWFLRANECISCRLFPSL